MSSLLDDMDAIGMQTVTYTNNTTNPLLGWPSAKGVREDMLTARVDRLVEGMPNGDPTGVADFAWCSDCGMVFAIMPGAPLPTHDTCLANPGAQTVALTHCASCARSYIASDAHGCTGVLYQPSETYVPDHGPKPSQPVLLYDTPDTKALIAAALHEVDCSPAICTCEDGAETFMAFIRGKRERNGNL